MEDFQAMAIVIALQTGIQLDLISQISGQVVDTMIRKYVHGGMRNVMLTHVSS